MTEVIEGTAVEVESRAVVVHQPGNTLVAHEGGAGDMIAHASTLATALAKMVEKQKLYTVIRGKKFPQVEAWMTIGRMDNVVARESQRPIRNDDGSYEGFVELVRLSDGMVVGGGSALCGTSDDSPWNSRSEPARRAMAVTRATSRAFRQQYSWIMALAGYEATPAEEMPHDEPAQGKPAESADPAPNHGEQEEMVGRVSRQGMVRKGTSDQYKLTPREGPDGHVIGFRLEIDSDKGIPQCVVSGPLGEALYLWTERDPSKLLGKRAKVSGILYHVRLKDNSWYRLHVDRFENDDVILPAEATDAAA